MDVAFLALQVVSKFYSSGHAVVNSWPALDHSWCQGSTFEGEAQKDGGPMQLHLCTWPEVETYLQRCTGIIIPMGSTEQHGPNGLIGTDALCAGEIAQAAAQTADAMVAPTLSYGVAPFNLAFPGTVSLRGSTFSQILLDCIASLARHGFTHIYCLNGHGGNIAPSQAAFSDLYTTEAFNRGGAAAPKCRLVSWWQYTRTNELRRELYGDAEGLHATPSEVAMTQHTHPANAHPMALPKLPSLRPDEFRRMAGDAHFGPNTHRERFADGRVGSAPDLATPDDGRTLLELAASEAAADFLAFLSE